MYQFEKVNKKLLGSQVEDELMNFILEEPLEIGQKIPNEFELHPEIEPLDSHPGCVCMGGYGEDGLASCEFFFPLRDCPDHKGTYPVFGKVIEGMDEIWRLEKVKTRPVDFPIPGVEVNEPVEPEVIEKVELDLKGQTYPEPVRMKVQNLPPCWTDMK